MATGSLTPQMQALERNTSPVPEQRGRYCLHHPVWAACITVHLLGTVGARLTEKPRAVPDVLLLIPHR